MAYAPASAFQRALPSPLSPPSCPCSCSRSPLQLQPLVGLPFRNPKYHAHEQRFKVISRAGSGILSERWDVTAASFGGFSPSQMDPTSVLLGQRIIFLGSQVDDLSADVIISQLLLLDAEDPTKDIKLLINSPGGSVTAGMGIYDAMKLCRADVSTICFGLAASMGAFLLASGTRGKRYCMPNARVMIHQPLGGAGGSAIDIGLQVREMMYHKIKLNKILSRLTGKPEKQIEIDTDRDNFMNAWEAVEYGLIDAVIDDGKPGLVAPIGEAIEPPKTQVWKYWMIREGRERKIMPSEDIITKEGKKDKDQSQPEKKETAAI